MINYVELRHDASQATPLLSCRCGKRIHDVHNQCSLLDSQPQAQIRLHIYTKISVNTASLREQVFAIASVLMLPLLLSCTAFVSDFVIQLASGLDADLDVDLDPNLNCHF